jgi:predicted anti-sigma-YlaC factor YlaD
MRCKTCQDLLDSLSDLNDEMVDELCATIEQHVTDCEKCRVLMGTLRKTVKLCRTLPQPVMPESARERLYRKLNLSGIKDRKTPAGNPTR